MSDNTRYYVIRSEDEAQVQHQLKKHKLACWMHTEYSNKWIFLDFSNPAQNLNDLLVKILPLFVEVWENQSDHVWGFALGFDKKLQTYKFSPESQPLTENQIIYLKNIFLINDLSPGYWNSSMSRSSFCNITGIPDLHMVDQNLTGETDLEFLSNNGFAVIAPSHRKTKSKNKNSFRLIGVREYLLLKITADGVFTTKNQRIDSMDAQSIEMLSATYFRDKFNCFFLTKLLSEAAPKTFKAFGVFYARDEKNVYFEDKQIAGADPGSFDAKLSKACDKNHLYHNGVTINQQSSDNNIDHPYSFMSDRRNVYYGSKPLPFANPKTIVFLDSGYAKDDTRVWFQSDLVEGADPKSFKSNKIWARAEDCHSKYSWGKKI